MALRRFLIQVRPNSGAVTHCARSSQSVTTSTLSGLQGVGTTFRFLKERCHSQDRMPRRRSSLPQRTGEPEPERGQAGKLEPLLDGGTYDDRCC